jgi:hypothetical protein
MIFKNSSLINSKNTLLVSILTALIPNINQQKMFKENDIFKNINLILSEPLHVFLEILFHQNQNNRPIQESIWKAQVGVSYPVGFKPWVQKVGEISSISKHD